MSMYEASTESPLGTEAIELQDLKSRRETMENFIATPRQNNKQSLNQNDKYKLENKELGLLKKFKESDIDEQEDLKLEHSRLETLISPRYPVTTAQEISKRTRTKQKVYESDTNDVGKRTSSSEGCMRSSEGEQSGDDSLEDFAPITKQTNCCSCLFGTSKVQEPCEIAVKPQSLFGQMSYKEVCQKVA